MKQVNSKQAIYDRILNMVVDKLEAGDPDELTPQMIQSIVSLLKLDGNKVADNSESGDAVTDMIKQLVQQKSETPTAPTSPKLSHHFQQP